MIQCIIIAAYGVGEHCMVYLGLPILQYTAHIKASCQLSNLLNAYMYSSNALFNTRLLQNLLPLHHTLPKP